MARRGRRMSLAYPVTTQVWDQGNANYSDLLGKIELYLREKLLPKILVPGVGKGRVIRDLVQRLSSSGKEFVLLVVEPDDRVLSQFTQWLKSSCGFTTNNESVFVKNNSWIWVFQESIEHYLLNTCQGRVDLVLCLLFFHYVSYGWLSILKRLYELLNPDGLFIVDRICGDEGTQILLECVDSHADQLQSLDMDNKDCLKWRAFYLNRILRKGAYWGSVIKGTDIKLIIEALEPLFEDHEICRAGGCTFELNKCHLPWWWGSDQEESSTASDCDVPSHLQALRLNLTFEFHIFRNKKADVVPESYWNLVKQNCIQTAVRNMNAILWFLEERKSLSFQDAERFIHDVLPSIVMQLVASSGIIDYRHRITSIFIASGSLSPELQLPKLQKLFILINDTDGEGETRIQAWLNNYVIYSNILRHPLSEDFIASGKRFALLPEKNMNQNLQNLLREFRYNPIPIWGGDQEAKLCHLKPPAVKQLLWWKLLQIDRSRGVEITKAAKCQLQKFTEAVQSVARQHGSTASPFSDPGLSIPYENLAPLSLLIEYVGTILFLPIPTYFEYSERGDFNVRSILGLGVTVESESLHREVLIGVEDVYTLVTLLLRRFQDNYLALRWISLSRISALRSAIAAIMARNLSHNIGSHILARLSTKDSVRTAAFNKDFLESVQSVRDKLEQPSTPLNGVMDDMRSLVQSLEDNIAPIADEVANLNGLLRTRMDFVADIATAQKPPPAMRVSFLGEVLTTWTKPVLFWDNLCASHGLKHEHITFRFKVDEHHVDINTGEEPKLDGINEHLKMATAGFPNGIIGCQAFYCIIENLLRNAVKHCKRPNGENLKVTICLYQDGDWKHNEHLMKIVIYDNWRACQDKGGLVDDINKRLNERVIRDDGSLIASNRGLKEMKAASAYLRGLTPESVEDSTIEPPLLTAVNVDGNLGYEFFVLRPKELLVAVAANEIPQDKYDLLRKQGVEIVTDAPTLLAKARDYPLLIVTSTDEDIRQALRDSNSAGDLPLRVVVQSDSEAIAQSGAWQRTIPYSSVKATFTEILKSLCEGDGIRAVARAWELWTRIVCQDRCPKLWIYEDGRLALWNVEDTSKLIKKSDKPDENTQVVMYARHGHPESRHSSVLFYEPYGKGVDPISFILENPSSQHEARKGLVYQLIDAGLTPILIVDERVQEAAHSVSREFSEHPEREPKEMAFWLKLMGVYIPSKDELDLESKQLKKEDIEGWVKSKIQALSNSKLPAILIIHQGILDVIGLQDSDQSQEWIDRLISNSGICDVVITSGRGVPDNVPPKARFLPLSILLLYTVERKSKFHLVHSLLTTRRVLKK